MRELRMSEAKPDRADAGRPTRRVRALVLAACAALVLASSPALAGGDEYDPQRAGHPLRIAGYVAYPVGFALDWLIFRPAHWIGGFQPFRAIFGRTDQQ